MTSKEIHNITRPFSRQGFHFKPEIKEGFYFIIERDFAYLFSVYFIGFIFKKYKIEEFNKFKKDFILKETNSIDLTDKFKINLRNIRGNSFYEVIGSYALTSIGLVSEYDFLLVKDLLDSQKRFNLKDINVGEIYKSDMLKGYIYVGSLNIRKNNKKFLSLDKQLLDIKTGKLVNFSSIKLLEFIGENKKNYNIILSRTCPFLLKKDSKDIFNISKDYDKIHIEV